jgi:hypothetical protein
MATKIQLLTTGEWMIDAANLDVPHIKRLVR